MKKLNDDTIKLISAINCFIHEVEDELHIIAHSNTSIQKHIGEFPINPCIKEPSTIGNYTKKIEWRIAHIMSEAKKLKAESHEVLFR